MLNPVSKLVLDLTLFFKLLSYEWNDDGKILLFIALESSVVHICFLEIADSIASIQAPIGLVLDMASASETLASLLVCNKETVFEATHLI